MSKLNWPPRDKVSYKFENIYKQKERKHDDGDSIVVRLLNGGKEEKLNGKDIAK